MKRLLPFLLFLLACAPKAVQPTPALGSVVVDMDFSNMKVLYQPPMPPYPREALLEGISGGVEVEVTIDPKGTPTQAKPISGRMELRKMAAAYVMGWRFEPVLLKGVPQYARFRVTTIWRMS